MSASIQKLMESDGESITYTASFRRMIEDHLPYIRAHETTETLNIRDDVAWRFHGDLIGVLLHYEFRRDLHWLIMRVNKYTSPMDFHYEDRFLHIPSTTLVSRLIRTHRAMKKMEKKEKVMPS